MNIFRNTGCSSGFCSNNCGNNWQDCGNSCCMPSCSCQPGGQICPDTITIGTTITGAPGTEARVTNSGTPQNPVLNFIIPQGATGQQGPQGIQGPQGPQGIQGVQGEPGATGPQGPAGAAGPQGPQGPTGPTGPQGPAGAGLETVTAFVPGTLYPRGAMVFYNGSLYQTAVQNPIGTPGSSADYNLISVAGPTGATGPAGAQGPAGATGPTGPAGPQGATGATGPTGPAGPVGPQGEGGPTGPAGAVGAQGAEGPTGPTGPTGPAGSPPALNALYATNTGSQTASSTGDPLTFDTNQVEQGSVITHTASTSDFSLTENGIYRITYAAVVTNTSGTGTVGLEVKNAGATVPGSVKEVNIPTTSNTATIGSTMLVNISSAPATITVNATQNNTTVTQAAIEIQKLN